MGFAENCPVKGDILQNPHGSLSPLATTEYNMLSTPLYSVEPTTSFLADLQQAGFFGWFTFDLSHDHSALWKAMALGLLQHTQIRYPQVHNFLESKWKPKISELCSVDHSFGTTNAKYSDENYWGEIGRTCEELVIRFFRENGKTAHIEEIQRKGYLNPSNKVAYDLMATYFNVCICWYESLADRQVMTHVFHSVAKGDVGLFICMAQEGNRLFFLYHQAGRAEVKLEFPFAMKVKECGKPLILGCSEERKGDDEDVRKVLMQKLIEVADSEAEFLLSICPSVPEESREQYLKMIGKIQAAKTYISLKKLEVDLATPSLQRVLNLPDYVPPAKPNDPHTILNCEQYPEDQDWVKYHGHIFHKICLSNYLLEINLQYPNMPKCPLTDCPQQLPDTVLDINPGIREAYERSQRRVQSDLQALNQYQQLLSASVPVASYNLTCVQCCRTERRYNFLQHGCQICISCAYRAGGVTCPRCAVGLTLDESTIVCQVGQQSWR